MPTPSLEQYFQAIRRHALLLVAGCLVGLLVGAYVLRQEEPRYTATATILLADLPSYASLDPDDPDARPVTIDTDAALLRSHDVVSRVADRTRREEVDVRSALAVSAVALTDVLRVSFSDEFATRAAGGAQVAAEALLDARAEALSSGQEEQIKELRDQTAKRIDRITRRLGDGIVEAHEDLLVSRLTSLRRFLNEVLRASPGVGTILRDAQIPNKSELVNPEVKLASGGMLGLLGGLVLGVVRDGSRRRRVVGPVPDRSRPGPPLDRYGSRRLDEPLDERAERERSVLSR